MDAADEDRATGGFDLARGIYPIIKCVTQSGVDEVAESELLENYERLTATRKEA